MATATSPSSAQNDSALNDSADRRGHARVELPEQTANCVTLQREDGMLARVRLRDISVGGARVELLEIQHPAAGRLDPAAFFEDVDWLLLRDCQMDGHGARLEGMHAQLVWNGGKQAGLLFEMLLE